jgi:hypothetical protein
MMGGHYPEPHEYPLSDLREEQSDVTTPPTPTHECQVCGRRVRIEDEFQTHVPHFCRACDEVQSHREIGYS